MPDLFATAGAAEPRDEMIAPGSPLLRGLLASTLVVDFRVDPQRRAAV